MTAEREIKNMLRGLPWETDPDVDARILADAFVAFDEAFASSPGKPERRAVGRGWGALLAQALRGPWRKTAMAGTTLAAVGVALLTLLSGNGLTLADVAAAVGEQTWVHVKYDNGREEWRELKEGLFFYRTEDGSVTLVDATRGRSMSYTPRLGGHVSGAATRPTPLSPWDSVVDPLDQFSKNEGPRMGRQAEKHADTVDGKRLIRFDLYIDDALGKRLLVRQLWADPQTRLPVRVRERIRFGLRKEGGSEFRAGQYDFPASGPRTLYDLGVPRNVEFLATRPKEPPVAFGVKEILAASKLAMDQFPEHYRAVLSMVKGEIDVLYRQGEKMRYEHYFNLPRLPRYHLPMPATTRQILDWTRTQVPVNMGLFDGQREYRGRNPHPAIPSESPATVRVSKVRRGGKVMLASNRNWPHELAWPHVLRLKPTALEQAPDLPAGCVVLRHTYGDDLRWDYYVDPGHDFVCVRSISWKKRSGNWVKEREYRLSDFNRLSTGQWYARSQHLTMSGDPKKGISGSEVEWKIDITVLEEKDYPPDTFNGKKFLEGAKVETY